MKLKLPRYQVHITSPIMILQLFSRTSRFLPLPLCQGSGELVWPVPITVDAESVSSLCMFLLDAVAAVVDSATDGDMVRL